VRRPLAALRDILFISPPLFYSAVNQAEGVLGNRRSDFRNGPSECISAPLTSIFLCRAQRLSVIPPSIQGKSFPELRSPPNPIFCPASLCRTLFFFFTPAFHPSWGPQPTWPPSLALFSVSCVFSPPFGWGFLPSVSCELKPPWR